MKITAHDAEDVLSDIDLGDDDAGDIIIDPIPLPVEQRKVQITPLFRGEHPFVAGRGNRTLAFSWVVSRVHADLATAVAFVWAHAAAVPINVELDVIEGSSTVSYTGVMTEVAAIEQVGVSTLFRYQMQGLVYVPPPPA
jgi:hypothetical protein